MIVTRASVRACAGATRPPAGVALTALLSSPRLVGPRPVIIGPRHRRVVLHRPLEPAVAAIAGDPAGAAACASSAAAGAAEPARIRRGLSIQYDESARRI